MDRLSNLPNEVLCHILSFLTTKEAAETSVLSKRWINLWTLVPNLEIDDSIFLYPEEGKREKDGILQCFMDFVDRVLALQGDSPIKKFSLKCRTGIDTNCVDRWIYNTVKRGVSHLELFLDFPEAYSVEGICILPEAMFVNKTLVELKLRGEYGFVNTWFSSEYNFLPMLKSLHIDLDWYILLDKMLLANAYPALEELYLNHMKWPYINLTVSSASLKKLTIYADCFEGLLNPKSMSFDTPSLVYFEYSDFVAEAYPIVNLRNLVEAQLKLMVTEDQVKLIRTPNDEDNVVLRLRNVWKLIIGIRNVQKLFLSADTLEVVSLCCESIPVFNKLKLLRIQSDKERGWQAMPVLLRNCPHLETLVLEGLLHYVTNKCGDACYCISRENRGCSLSSCPVKKMQINGFQGTTREIDMIKHFLESFPCLKEMKIYVEENDSTGFEAPGMLKLVTQMFTRFDKFYSCDVQFFV